MRGKYKPTGISFSHLENAILELQRAKMVTNTYIFFHIEYSLSEPKNRERNRVNWKATETMFLESIDLYAKN